MLLASPSANTAERFGARTSPNHDVHVAATARRIEVRRQRRLSPGIAAAGRGTSKRRARPSVTARYCTLKTTLILIWTKRTSYVALTFLATTWWRAIPTSDFCWACRWPPWGSTSSDGSHHAFSDRRWVNRLMAMSLDLLGGSSYVWAVKHNVVHHSFSNITGHDDDINIGFRAAIATSKRMKIRLATLLSVGVRFCRSSGSFTATPRRGPGPNRGTQLPARWVGTWSHLIGGKPALPSWHSSSLMAAPRGKCCPSMPRPHSRRSGARASSFNWQCVEDGIYASGGRMESAWAVHQIETTVDFARDNRLLSALVGGLNFQIEHHLFPRICATCIIAQHNSGRSDLPRIRRAEYVAPRHVPLGNGLAFPLAGRWEITRVEAELISYRPPAVACRGSTTKVANCSP